jgi:hypothetical protein
MTDGYQTNKNRLFKTLVELEKVNSTAKVPTFLEEVARVYRLRTAAYLGVGNLLWPLHTRASGFHVIVDETISALIR